MREYVATAKTVEEAIQLGCEALSVDRDDLGVSYEILENRLPGPESDPCKSKSYRGNCRYRAGNHACCPGGRR